MRRKYEPVLAVPVEVLQDGLGPFHEEVQNLRDRRSEVPFLEETHELDASDQLHLWHNEAVPERALNEEGAIFLRQLANLLLENLRLHLDPTQGPAHVLERCEDILLLSTYKRPSNRANTNETEQTTPNNQNHHSKP